ncbi:hypothetical protein AB0D45_06880 [Streptomyces sp. NPDC048352]|uniref:hypothetical protein n=1 Tax=Streptomyces sp. NPDC048352 TaxID=3154718 RepID=UPI00341B251E
MSDSSWNPALPPIKPFYPFNDVGEPVALHHADIGGMDDTDLPGEINLRCSPVLSLDWNVTPRPGSHPPSQDTTTLRLQRPHGQAEVHAWVRDFYEGWINGDTLGDGEAPLARIVAHWFNLPRLRGQHDLTDREEGGDQYWHHGRWSHEVDGWKIVLDVRPDHAEVWDRLVKSRLYAMTHVLEISRANGKPFTAAEAGHVLTALHFGMSFSLGRWTAPLLPVGLGPDGRVVWESWGAVHCDAARKLSSGWWDQWDLAALGRFLDRLVPAMGQPMYAESLRLQISYAITAIRDQGFVEQRVMIGAAGLEHAMWQRLCLSGTLTRAEYKNTRLWPAHEKLRKVLRGINVEVSIDRNQLPAVAAFADEMCRRSGQVWDGPSVVTKVRNYMVHPEEDQKELYRIPGLVTETWALTRHYLSLLVLESLGYRGPHQNLSKLRGVVGEVEVTPWP